MSDLSDTIQETIESVNENKLNSWIAILVAITATFMAICNIKGGNIVQNMASAQSKSVDTWSYFQAKSTKQNLAENTLEMIQTDLLLEQNKEQKKVIESKIDKYTKKVEKYEKEKNEIKAEALSYEKKYDDLNVFDDQFDMTEAFLSIAIAMYGITALTRKKFLFVFAISLSCVGIILGVTAFLGIPLHSDFISSILG